MGSVISFMRNQNGERSMKEILFNEQWHRVIEESENFFVIPTEDERQPGLVFKRLIQGIRDFEDFKTEVYDDVSEHCKVIQDQLFDKDRIVGTIFPPYKLYKKVFPSSYEGVYAEGFVVLRERD